MFFKINIFGYFEACKCPAKPLCFREARLVIFKSADSEIEVDRPVQFLLAVREDEKRNTIFG
jgi:hypothetical protein